MITEGLELAFHVAVEHVNKLGFTVVVKARHPCSWRDCLRIQYPVYDPLRSQALGCQIQIGCQVPASRVGIWSPAG